MDTTDLTASEMGQLFFVPKLQASARAMADCARAMADCARAMEDCAEALIRLDLIAVSPLLTRTKVMKSVSIDIYIRTIDEAHKTIAAAHQRILVAHNRMLTATEKMPRKPHRPAVPVARD